MFCNFGKMIIIYVCIMILRKLMITCRNCNFGKDGCVDERLPGKSYYPLVLPFRRQALWKVEVIIAYEFLSSFKTFRASWSSRKHWLHRNFNDKVLGTLLDTAFNLLSLTVSECQDNNKSILITGAFIPNTEVTRYIRFGCLTRTVFVCKNDACAGVTKYVEV